MRIENRKFFFSFEFIGEKSEGKKLEKIGGTIGFLSPCESNKRGTSSRCAQGCI